MVAATTENAMSTLNPTSPSDALLLLQALLDGLLQWLAPDQQEGRDPANLDPLLDEALQQAGNASLYGVSALLRIWSSAMTQRAREQSILSESEKAQLHDWFSGLQHYCLGQLDQHGQRGLLAQLATMPNLAALPPRLHAYLCDRLEETRPHIQALLAESLLPAAALGTDLALPLQETALQHDDYVDETLEDRWVDVGAQRPALVHAAIETGEPEVLLRVAATEDSLAVHADAWVIAASPGEIGDFEDSGFAVAMTDTVIPTQDNLTLDTVEPFGTIWISPEELQLAMDAVGNQILPSIRALADALDQDTCSAAVAELEFNLGLVGNALEMLGTPALSRGVLAMQTSVAGSMPPQADDLDNWAAALAAFLADPNDENAELLTVFSAVAAELDSDWALLLQHEAARIRIGLDPRLLALRKTTATPADVILHVASDVLPNVLEGMLRELPGNAERLGNAVRRLIATGDTTPIEEARRVAHTLKGDANTVGVFGLANLSHTLEDLLTELYKHPQRLEPALCAVLDQTADCVEEIADHLLGRGPSPDNVRAIYQSLLDWSGAVVGHAQPPTALDMDQSGLHVDTTSAPLAETAPVETVPTVIKQSPSAMLEPVDAQHTRTATLTVAASLLDELQRLAGETLVMARQIDQRLTLLENMHRDQVAEVRNSSGLLGKLDDLISLRGAALQSTALRGGSEIDPLELDQYNELHVVSRRLLESNADNNEYQQRLDALLIELDELRNQQETVNADLQRTVQRARTVPFDQISGRLQRIVRQTARQLERQVELQLIGANTLLDAELLDRIVEPLGHLLRNAIDHGLEDSDTRRTAGKPEIGLIQVSVSTVADSIEIRVEDNGRGLDYAGIRSKALALGVLAHDREVSEVELTRLILTPGFTTRREATQISGRGIGMDVVNQRVIDLRGQLQLASVHGRGLSVIMRLPVSQTMANVIIAFGHDLILGAVAGSVERVHSFSANELIYSADGQISLMIDDERVPVYPIETLYDRHEGRLSLPTASGLGLVVRSARGRRVLISVSSIGEVSNVIVKPISPLLPPVPSVRGMTLLGDGRLAAVIDMSTLIDVLDAEAQGLRLGAVSSEQTPLPRVVVADDSLSVRRALAELMKDAGFEVATARDGLEALELVNSVAPALVILDLEMPKLNGLEVTRFMRSRAQTRHVPVVMITSRASEKYRTQAEEAGVTLMLGKPFAEDELIMSVRKLMAVSTDPVKAMQMSLENS